MRIILTLIAFLKILEIQSQDSTIIQFKTILNNQQLELNTFNKVKNDSTLIESVRYYISDIQLFNNGNLIYAVEKKHFLIDIEDPASCKISLLVKETFNEIQFTLGIDSLVNVSGAFPDELDPTNGMYWTWQNGYINFKLEGISSSVKLSPPRFYFHIGGYRQPFPTAQKLIFKNNKRSDYTINLNLDTLFKKLNLSEMNKIMSPSNEAFLFSQYLKDAFFISE